jgi:hypothetical protein
MSNESKPARTIRKTAVEIPPPSKEDLDRLRRAMEGPIDTSDVPEQVGEFLRLKRDSADRLPRRKPPQGDLADSPETER